MQPSEMFKNESGAGGGVCAWRCVLLRDTDVWAVTSLLAQTMRARWNWRFGFTFKVQHQNVFTVHDDARLVLLTVFNVTYDFSPSNSNLLFSGDVTLTYGCTIHLGHLHVALDLSEIQAEVLATDRHKRASLPWSTQGSDLLKFWSTLMI